MNLLLGGLACLALAFFIVAFHDETLQFVTHRFLPRIPRPKRWHVAATVLILIAAHVVEIIVCAVAIFAAVRWLHIGGLEGEVSDDLVTYLYFSFSCYTSLGTGDVYPVGWVRLVAGMESLVGLMMIGWSASYLLLEMREFRSHGRRHPGVDSGPL